MLAPDRCTWMEHGKTVEGPEAPRARGLQSPCSWAAELAPLVVLAQTTAVVPIVPTGLLVVLGRALDLVLGQVDEHRLALRIHSLHHARGEHHLLAEDPGTG